MKKLNVKLPQGGSKRALHSGMYASALAVVVLAVIILVNLVIRALPTKYTAYDISTTSLFTLSDTTENLLHELNADVTAYYLAESGQEDANITRLLDRYAGESSHFSWQQRRAAPWQPGHAVCRDTGPQTGDLLRPRPRPARGYYRDLRQGPRDNDRARRNQGTVCGTGDRGGVLGAVNFTLPSPLGGEGGSAGPDEGRACRSKP